MNFFERAILTISPAWAYKREQYRTAREIYVENARKFDGATKGRRGEGWRATGTSANAEIGPALHMLRNRARDLVRNNVYAKRAVNAYAYNVVGKGIMPAPYPGQLAERNKTRLMAAWNGWADKRKVVDWDGKKNFYGIQKLVMRTVAESGECLVIRRRAPKLNIPFQLQVVEADYIDTQRNYVPGVTGDEYDIQGVRFNKDGKIIGYWLFDAHPGDSYMRSVTSRLVPAEDVLHIYEQLRPGQVRGIPFGVASFLKMRDFDDYQDAQLMKQKVAACFAAFVTDTTQLATEISGAGEDNYEKVQPGMIEYLPAGKDVKFANPPAVEGYKDFSTVNLQGIAMGYEVPYELLTGDLSNVNFSSARMGWIEFQRRITDLQTDMLIPDLCEPVWEWFVEAAMLRGIIPTTEVSAGWTPPKREMINPTEEIKAAAEMVRMGFSSWQEQVRQFGYDPEDVISELAEDYGKFTANGFMLASDPRYDTNRRMENQGQPPQE